MCTMGYIKSVMMLDLEGLDRGCQCTKSLVTIESDRFTQAILAEEAGVVVKGQGVQL